MMTTEQQSPGTAPSPITMPPQSTGRRLIQFDPDVPKVDAERILAEVCDQPIATVSKMGSLSAAVAASSASDGVLLLDQASLAVVGGGTDAAARMAEALMTRDGVIDTRPEFWMFAIATPPWQDGAATTWGLDATGASASGYDGSGVRIAVLDTGIDLGHGDYAGRTIVTASFTGETVDDVKGHGTHCAGTASGSRRSVGNIPGYGVAPGADLYVGKVLNNRGAGREGDIIAGIGWAITERCDIISMSLGRAVGPDEPFDPVYETIARRALESGCLIVAAAGNESDRRYRYIAPVGAPANAPSIMAVAAIGADGGVANFSCGGVGTGAVDIAGPGVGIFSTVPRPQLYTKLSGTSMACPHVAGLAALWAQSDSALRGTALWKALTSAAVPVGGLSMRDVGAGLAKAP